MEDAATPQKDVEEPALTVPIVESVAQPEEIVNAMVEEAEAPPAEEHHEVAVPADEVSNMS